MVSWKYTVLPVMALLNKHNSEVHDSSRKLCGCWEVHRCYHKEYGGSSSKTWLEQFRETCSETCHRNWQSWHGMWETLQYIQWKSTLHACREVWTPQIMTTLKVIYRHLNRQAHKIHIVQALEHESWPQRELSVDLLWWKQLPVYLSVLNQMTWR